MTITDDEYELIRAFESIYWGEIARRDQIGAEIYEKLQLEAVFEEIGTPSYQLIEDFEVEVHHRCRRYWLKVFHDPENVTCNWKFMYVLNPYEALPKDYHARQENIPE